MEALDGGYCSKLKATEGTASFLASWHNHSRLLLYFGLRVPGHSPVHSYHKVFMYMVYTNLVHNGWVVLAVRRWTNLGQLACTGRPLR
jgi:hypothetical protein